jgi:TusA-related sulfurtransferase
MDEEQVLECRGLACPQPVIQTREALERLQGSRLRVILDSKGACIKVRRFAEGQGHAVTVEEAAGPFMCGSPGDRRTGNHWARSGLASRGEQRDGGVRLAPRRGSRE